MPTHLTITISVPHMVSAKEAQLDINSSHLVFAVKDLYYLDTNLFYKVDADKGSAKLDKAKKQMVIVLPVVGQTDVSEEKLRTDFQGY